MMDILARAPLKGVAKRDSLCELQNSVRRWPPERALRSGNPFCAPSLLAAAFVSPLFFFVFNDGLLLLLVVLAELVPQFATFVIRFTKRHLCRVPHSNGMPANNA